MTLTTLRQFSQLSGTVFSNSYIGTLFTRSINTNALKGICVPFLNCYSCPSALFSCPLGTLQHFMAIRAIPFYLLAFLSLIGLTIGRMACGWVCPFGFLQDLMYRIKSVKIGMSFNLKYLKYAVLLLLVIIIPYNTGEMCFSKLCPMGTLSAGIPWALWNPSYSDIGRPVLPDGPGLLFYLSILVLTGFMAWFVFCKRPFCRAVCPIGAIFSLFNRYSMIRLSVGRNCDGCDICRVKCPMDLNVSLDFDSGECIRCLECTQCGHVHLTAPFLSPKEVKADG